MLVGGHWESNQGPLTSVTSVLTTELRQPDNLNITNFIPFVMDLVLVLVGVSFDNTSTSCLVAAVPVVH